MFRGRNGGCTTGLLDEFGGKLSLERSLKESLMKLSVGVVCRVHCGEVRWRIVATFKRAFIYYSFETYILGAAANLMTATDLHRCACAAIDKI